MAHSNVVINLLGRLRPTVNFSLEEVNIDAAARIAKAARDAGVVRLIHVSDNVASVAVRTSRSRLLVFLSASLPD